MRMAKYLKTPNVSLALQQEDDQYVATIVSEMISEIQQRGDEVLREYSQRFDDYITPTFRVSDAEIKKCMSTLSVREVDDLKHAHHQVRKFAEAQKTALTDIEIEIRPGVHLGHKNIPIENVGCYIPGGLYPLVSVAGTSIVTAKVAGVARVIAMTPPLNGNLPSKTIAAMHLAGADEIYCLGGAQAIAAMALGTKSIPAVDFIVGPGNPFVSEAKRQLFGKIGIDLLAGPTETLIIADDSCDAETCATDLLGQAEHGPNSPSIMITDSWSLAEDTLAEIKQQLKTLATANIAGAAWDDYGAIIVCKDEDEMIEQADLVASEHVQVMTHNPNRFLNEMKNYGSLFLGQRTNVAFGDKVIGTNNILPTRTNAKFTGGLWVGKFLKTCTYQYISTNQAAVETAEYCSRLCSFDGMVAHKAQSDLRIKKYQAKNNKT